MTTQSLVILIILIILSITIIGTIIFIGIELDKELKRKRKLQEVMVYADMFRNTTSIYELLDSYINELFDEYRVFNSEMFQKGILSNAEQTKIVKDITVNVIETISPAFYNQLSLVFNPDKQKLQSMINNRVVMAILAYNLGLNEAEI